MGEEKEVIIYSGMNENDDSKDGMKVVTDSGLAETAIGFIRHFNIRPEEIGGPFLGLGAGMGFAERALADKLGITDVTLVDKHMEKLWNYSGKYIKDDIFSYIQKTREKYGVVSAFSIEYVLHNQDKWNALWSGLTKITKPKSLVVVFPDYWHYGLPDGSVFSIINNGSLLIAQRNH